MTATLFVTKIEAARRQINAAIRMYFLQVDDLAITTVIGAARNIVRDLSKRRGSDGYESLIKSGLILAIQSWLRGEPHPPEVEEVFSELVKEKRSREWWLSLNPRDAKESPLTVKGSHILWAESVKAINFLKHADRDHNAMLKVSDLQNIERIGEASVWFADLGLPFSDEMRAFNLYCRSLSSNLIALDNHLQHDVVEHLASLTDKQKRNYCLKIISL